MGNIVLLDDLTINKIAAGEVIERPASVVKEMVENSIDAGATKITVEIKNGGISFIRVSDNGKGIEEDDMEIAFERHATSKIRVADDISKVTSMGFRGEALASIAAIANVEMISRTANNNLGHRIVVEGGNVKEKSEVGAPIGTSITVKNLFYNTPVRYKFLKKDYTESGYIEDVITRLSLVNKNISFKLINSGKTIIQTSGNGDEKSVIYSIYGKDIAEAIIDTNYDYEGIKVTGAVGKPEIARSNRSNQIFFVNSRYVKDRTLTAAAEQAFKGMIPINKFGFVILNIDLDPKLVDVNVHPAKLEVRFEDDNKIFKAVYYAIKQAFSKKELVQDISKLNTNLIFEGDSKKAEELRKEAQKVVDSVKAEIEQAKQQAQEKNVNEEKNKEKSSEEISENVYNFRKELKEIGVSETPATVYVPGMTLERTEKENKVEDDISVPSEEQVEETTRKLIEQREDEEEKKENSKSDMSFTGDVQKEFEKKYAELFGNTITHTETKENPELTESERKVLDEIRNSIRVDKKKVENTIERSEENTVENSEEKAEDIENVNVKSDADMKNFQENKEKDESKDDKPIISNDNSEQIEEFRNMSNKNYKFIGIVFSTYIIVEIEDEMYIIDQHAAHERIRYEQVKANYYNEAEKDSQLMLLPDVITLSHKETQIIKENLEMFEKAGFSLEAFGENTIKLNGVPTFCIDMNTKELFLELLDEIDNFSRTDKQDKEERFIATIACKSAVKANMHLNEEEVDKLMEELLKLPNPFTCPHGRPTAIKMSRYEMERKFSRK